MKKRALAILMILVLVTTGLFAVTAGNSAYPATATLNANITGYLYHGFNDNTTRYLGILDVNDAFNAVTPTFKYGYKTNTTNRFSFTMNVGDFLKDGTSTTRKVLIQGVKFGATAVLPLGTYGRVYEVFDYTGNGTYKVDEKTITVIPALNWTTGLFDITGAAIPAANTVNGDSANSGAPAGDYISKVVFSVTAI